MKTSQNRFNIPSLIILVIVIIGGYLYIKNEKTNKVALKDGLTSQPTSQIQIPEINKEPKVVNSLSEVKEYTDGYNYNISIPSGYTLVHQVKKQNDPPYLVDYISISGPASLEPMHLEIWSQPIDVTGKIYKTINRLISVFMQSEPLPEIDSIKIDGVTFLKLVWENGKISMYTMKDGFIYQMDNLESETAYLRIAQSLRFYPPVISGISTTTGPVGTSVVIDGENLSGEGGSLDAWIENEAGEIGFLGHTGETAYPESKQIKFKIEDSACRKIDNESGNCTDYLKIISGNYKIFTQPWGKKSNYINFIVTDK